MQKERERGLENRGLALPFENYSRLIFQDSLTTRNPILLLHLLLFIPFHGKRRCLGMFHHPFSDCVQKRGRIPLQEHFPGYKKGAFPLLFFASVTYARLNYSKLHTRLFAFRRLAALTPKRKKKPSSLFGSTATRSCFLPMCAQLVKAG